MQGPLAGRVVSIAIRPARNAPMQEISAAEVHAERGIAGDLPAPPDRGVTLISAEQWQQVIRELGVDLPWHTRRANVLVEGLVMADLVGRELAIGTARLRIVEETKPCGLMDQLYPGLRQTLEPDLRGGVHGRVIQGGTIHPGDEVRLIDKA